MMKILVCCPPISDNFAYYPYIDMILRDELKDYNVSFHRCIYYRFTPSNVRDFDEVLKTTDILCLSCYIWNFQLQLIITKRARLVNPDIIIVAGGPQLHSKYYSWFDHNIIGECEGSLQQILDGHAPHVINYPRKTEFPVSPYIINSLLSSISKNIQRTHWVSYLRRLVDVHMLARTVTGVH